MGKRENFTADRLSGYGCEAGKSQTIHWDAKAPGLGLRVTAAGARAYVFESRLFGKTVRVTIGDPKAWSLGEARSEAARLKTLVDAGRDPREVREQQRFEHEARRAERRRKAVTFGEAWEVYVESRKARWSPRHYADHLTHAAPGGAVRKRATGLTVPGPLAALRAVLLADLTGERIAQWLEAETASRPTMAALSFRLLRGFIRWADDVPAYRGIVPTGAYRTRVVRDALPRVAAKEGDSLQREQLAAWFGAVRALPNVVISTYLQALLLTGARREELLGLRWVDVDFQWRSLRIADKVEEGGRVIPMTPYLASLLRDLKRRNDTPPVRVLRPGRGDSPPAWQPSPWVFSSATSADGRLAEPRIAHNKALAVAGLPHVTLHGLRRSFGTLAEWCEVPVGVVAQIQGHKPSAVAEKHYRRRPLDLLRMWHDRIEAWMLREGEVPFDAPVVSEYQVVGR